MMMRTAFDRRRPQQPTPRRERAEMVEQERHVQHPLGDVDFYRNFAPHDWPNEYRRHVQQTAPPGHRVAPPPRRRRGGRQRGELVVDDNNFPALGRDVAQPASPAEVATEEGWDDEEDDDWGRAASHDLPGDEEPYVLDMYIYPTPKMVDREPEPYLITAEHVYDEERIRQDLESLTKAFTRQPCQSTSYRRFTINSPNDRNSGSTRTSIRQQKENERTLRGRGGAFGQVAEADVNWDTMLPDEDVVKEYLIRSSRVYAEPFGPVGREEFEVEKNGATEIGQRGLIRVEKQMADPLRRLLLSTSDENERELLWEAKKYGSEKKQKELAKRIEVAIPNTNLSMVLGSGGVATDLLQTWSGQAFMAASPLDSPPSTSTTSRFSGLGGFSRGPRPKLPVYPPPARQPRDRRDLPRWQQRRTYTLREYGTIALDEDAPEKSPPQKFTTIIVPEADMNRYRDEELARYSSVNEKRNKAKEEKLHQRMEAIQVEFGSVEAAAAAISAHPGLAKPAPRDLLLGGRSRECEIVQKETMVEYTWKRCPIQSVSVPVENATVEERRDAAHIIASHGFSVKPYKGGRYCGDVDYATRLVVRIPDGGCFTDDEEVSHIHDIIQMNRLRVDRRGIKVNLAREQNINGVTRHRDVNEAVSRRIFEAFQAAGYFNDTSFDRMKPAYDLPWRIDVQYEETSVRTGFNKATVYIEPGELTTEMEKDLEKRSEGFPYKLNVEDCKGVRLRVESRVVMMMTRSLRALYHEDIVELGQRLDRERRVVHYSVSDSHVSQRQVTQWAVIRDLSEDKEHVVRDDECTLEITGVPMSYLEATADRLAELMKGDRIRCNEEDGTTWLLTGFGREMAEKEAARFPETKVIVDFDLLGSAITLFGRRHDRLRVRNTLIKIAKDRNSHIITTSIPVCWPLYLDKTGYALAYVGLPKLQKIIGGNIHLFPEKGSSLTLLFKGSVRAYGEFRSYIDRLDDKLRTSSEQELLRRASESPMNLPDPATLPSATLPSPPLLLCPVCFCRVPDNFYCLAACGHYYCMDCLVFQMTSELQSRTLPLTCHHEGCGSEISIEDILRLLLGDNDNRIRALDAVKLAPLVRAAMAIHMNKDKSIFHCIQAGCEGVFMYKERSLFGAPPANASVEVATQYTEYIVKCTACHVAHCGNCGLEPHDMPCEQYKEIRADVDVSLNQWKEAHPDKVRVCPNRACGVVIEKEMGCNHMKCSVCNIHFCWICLFSSETEGAVYKHMSNEHGGAGGGWEFDGEHLVQAPPGEMDEEMWMDQQMLMLLMQNNQL